MRISPMPERYAVNLREKNTFVREKQPRKSGEE